jgi:hypothetical protein
MTETSWSTAVSGHAFGIMGLEDTGAACELPVRVSEALRLCERQVAALRGVVARDEGACVPKGWPIYEIWVAGTKFMSRADSEIPWRQFAFAPDESGRFYSPSVKAAFVEAIQSILGEGSQIRMWLRGYSDGEASAQARLSA